MDFVYNKSKNSQGDGRMVANVLVELANKKVDRTFDYLVPSSLVSMVKVGIRVMVPFGSRF